MGTCYFVSSAAAVADFPDRIKDLFINKNKTKSGINAIKLYIRGKPWVISVDNFLYFQMNVATGERLQLIFAKSYPSKSMWAPILEKAWAKAKGNYLATNGG